jgi:hypothetical protein
MIAGDRSLAKCSGVDLGIEDHGCPFLYCRFSYEDGGTQGFGTTVDTDFLMGFMGVFGVRMLREVNGMSCWVTHEVDRIHLVEPLHRKDGKPFDVDAWAKAKRHATGEEGR